MNLESPQTPGPQLPPPPPPAPPPAPRADHRSSGVETLLAGVRARQRRLLWLEGALLGAATLLVLLVAGGFLALAAPSAGRWVMMLAPVAGAAVAGVLGVYLALRTVGDDVRTARLIGERRPELSLDVLAAVELSRGRGPASSHSPTLVDAFLRQMDERTRQVDVRTVVEGTRLRRAGLVLGGVMLALLVVLGLGGEQWRKGVARALDSSRQPERPVQLEPITGDIELTYRYPAYTGLTPRTVPGTNGEVSAPAGTEVALKTRSDREVARAELVVNGETLPLVVEGQRELSGSFLAKKSGSYHFVFYGTGKKPLVTGPDIPLNVEVDAPPQVTLLTPAAEIEVDPGEQVTLKYEATDDYGLSGVTATIRLDDPQSAFGPDALVDLEPIEIPLSLPGVAPKEAKAASFHDFTHHLWAGLPVTITLTATDATGQSASSEPVSLTLPERELRHPTARALINLRRDL
ncbi:MAG TPA: DUF4175 family protein, partial [Myxococcaceae bacterium]|nr:DUF4175 family protein [Myxococcaceae bacterium]